VCRNDDERRQAHAHNRMKSTQRWERVEELQGQVTDFEDKLRRAGSTNTHPVPTITPFLHHLNAH
jgi:hypothetical protein